MENEPQAHMTASQQIPNPFGGEMFRVTMEQNHLHDVVVRLNEHFDNKSYATETQSTKIDGTKQDWLVLPGVEITFSDGQKGYLQFARMNDRATRKLKDRSHDTYIVVNGGISNPLAKLDVNPDDNPSVKLVDLSALSNITIDSPEQISVIDTMLETLDNTEAMRKLHAQQIAEKVIAEREKKQQEQQRKQKARRQKARRFIGSTVVTTLVTVTGLSAVGAAAYGIRAGVIWANPDQEQLGELMPSESFVPIGEESRLYEIEDDDVMHELIRTLDTVKNESVDSDEKLPKEVGSVEPQGRVGSVLSFYLPDEKGECEALPIQSPREDDSSIIGARVLTSAGAPGNYSVKLTNVRTKVTGETVGDYTTDVAWLRVCKTSDFRDSTRVGDQNEVFVRFEDKDTLPENLR